MNLMAHSLKLIWASLLTVYILHLRSMKDLICIKLMKLVHVWQNPIHFWDHQLTCHNFLNHNDIKLYSLRKLYFMVLIQLLYQNNQLLHRIIQEDGSIFQNRLESNCFFRCYDFPNQSIYLLYWGLIKNLWLLLCNV